MAGFRDGCAAYLCSPTTPCLYLIPDYDTQEEAEGILEEVYEAIFEAELDYWNRDTGTWPAERTYAVFRKWFEVRFYPLIQDLVGEAQVLPLLAGLLLRRWKPKWVARLEGPLDKLANGLLLLLIVLVLIKAGPLLVPFIASNWLALGFMAVMVAAALAIGYFMAGPEPRERTTVALVTSMRNPGLALLFASSYGAGMVGLKLAVLSYLLVTVLLSIPFLRWQRQRQQAA